MNNELFQTPCTSRPPSPLRRVPDGTLLRVDAAAIADGTGFFAAPASILLEVGPSDLPTILAVGTPGEVDRHPAAASPRLVRVNRSSSILIPGLVNAHAHLDLTHMGPRAFEREKGFFGWGMTIGRERRRDEQGIAESVRTGIVMSVAGGTVAVGDIAGSTMHTDGSIRASLVPWRELFASPLMGVSYLEFFAMGPGRLTGRDGVERSIAEAGKRAAGGKMRLGLQPHAPYSVDRREYLWAIARAQELGLPVATHLAEHVDEREFVAEGTGPARDFLEKIGKWDASVLDEVGRGESPVQHLEKVLAQAEGMLVAHVNDVDDAAIKILSKTGTSVAYCPRCSEYFGHAEVFGPHRYKDMLAAGVNVCLGTDSIVNLPADTDRLSVLDEMRLLYRRDGWGAGGVGESDPALLLRMGTINGAKALGMDPAWWTFASGNHPAGLVAVELGTGQQAASASFKSLFQGDGGLSLLLGGKYCTLTEIRR